MADTRCPMCAKVNPDDREECQYCGARLVPLIIEAPPEEEGERGSGGAAAESAAWERGSGSGERCLGAGEKETGEAGFEGGFSEFEAEGSLNLRRRVTPIGCRSCEGRRISPNPPW